jgi:hypothetical protein
VGAGWRRCSSIAMNWHPFVKKGKVINDTDMAHTLDYVYPPF